MQEFFTILIADRNSHVRMFLLRELMAEGYRVKMAATAENVLKMAYARDGIDLLILDPDLPGIDLTAMLTTLADRIPVLPVVLHTHRGHDETLLRNDDHWIITIEKAGDSVERIKEAVGRLLRSSMAGISEAAVHRRPGGKIS
jgi:DNA-binding NtrC family response regulator